MSERLRAGRRVALPEALFPRYLFVRLEAGRSNWSAIRSARGVVRLVEFGGVAARISSALMGALSEKPAKQKVLFEAGERFDAVAAGMVQTFGVDEDRIVAEIPRLLTAPSLYASMSVAHNSYGDGQAAEKIAEIVEGN